MGATLSAGLSDTGEALEHRLGDMPENCAALVLMRFDPPEICRLARLNRTFHDASTADFIWESKLPSNYGYILNKVFGGADALAGLGKKDVYAKLCRSNPFDDGTKEFWLDKRTGGVCLSISSKALKITGIDDRRYWSFLPTEESRFQTVAYLQQTWWFEVNGEFEFLLPAGTYSVFFRLHLGKSTKRMGRRTCNLEHVHGWNIKPVQFQLTTSNGQHVESQFHLANPGNWVCYHVGDFVVKNPVESTKINFSATQIDCTHTKGGLCVDSVLIYPIRVGKSQ